jgi:hypothetical protein
VRTRNASTKRNTTTTSLERDTGVDDDHDDNDDGCRAYCEGDARQLMPRQRLWHARREEEANCTTRHDQPANTKEKRLDESVTCLPSSCSCTPSASFLFFLSFFSIGG